MDLDDVVAECAIPYVRKFAREFGVDLPDEEIGWQTLDKIDVPEIEKARFRVRTYDGRFFSDLEPYEDCPLVLERLVNAGHEVFFITARAEKRRVITETWLREKGLFDHARAVHLRPPHEVDDEVPRGKYDPTASARYKVRLAHELELERFCEDDRVISRTLAESGIHVWLFDHPWNRDVLHPNLERVSGWTDVAERLGL